MKENFTRNVIIHILSTIGTGDITHHPILHDTTHSDSTKRKGKGKTYKDWDLNRKGKR
jgi:hypothetical protein